MPTGLKLSARGEAILRSQVFDEAQPGSVLHDFGAVLDFLGTEGVAAQGKYNLLPIAAIPDLDERLARPLRLDLKRPQLRSHPYLQGLHLLLRASGLTRVGKVESKTRLMSDPVVVEQWRRLKATEQYFTLLGAWLLNGRAEMVGERAGNFPDMLGDCVATWRHLPQKGKRFRVDDRYGAWLHPIGRAYYQLALIDLFGLLAVERPTVPVKPWSPAGVQHTPFGDALQPLLARKCRFAGLFAIEEPGAIEENSDSGQRDAAGDVDGEEPLAEMALGEWQSFLQPYFPAYQKSLVLPEPERRDGMFVFRVSLGKTWRRIAMPADATLDELVTWILRSVDFDNDHLYEFQYRDRFGAEVRVSHPECEEGPWTTDIHIGELPLEPGHSMTLIYDFGDSWQFDVRLERIDPPTKKHRSPRIVAKHGDSPEQYADC